MKKNLLLIFAIPFLQVMVTSAVFAQPWAEAMFPERRHSFGSVALGSESVYRFQFKNPYSDDIHIASVRSSCACTTTYWPKTPIKFGETAEIVAKLNTDGQFQGERKATLTVEIDRPSRAQVQLQVTGYIRPDVVISPGRAEFGSISEGTSAQKVLSLLYAGRANWKLTKVECSNPHIEVDATPLERNDGRIEYRIVVTLRETMPSGYVHDMVRFTTNDATPNASVVMFPVYGFVTTPLVAKPSPLVVGFVQPGETIKKNIVLHSDVPFRITKVTSKDRRFQFAVSDDKNNSIHVLPIAFTADSSLGALSEPIIVHTTLAGQKQMQLVTQGMVYDASLFDDHQGRLKHQLAGQSPASPASPVSPVSSAPPAPLVPSEPAEPTHSPPIVRESQKIAGLPQQSSSRVQIRMGPTETAFEDVTSQPTTNTIAINMNAEENQPGEIAVVIVDVADNSHEADEPAVVRQEETLAFVPDLKIVPRLAPGESATGFETPGTIPPSRTAMRQEPVVSLIPAPTAEQQPVKDLLEAPLEAVNEPAIEHANMGLSVQATAVPSQNPDTPFFSGFQVVTDDAPVGQQPVSPKVDAPTGHPLEVVAEHPGLEPPAVERTPSFADTSPDSPLPFSVPSIKTNLEVFTGTKPQQPVTNSSNAFAVVDDSQNAISGNGTSLRTGASPKESRVISETPPARIPPMPEMTPAQSPGISPFVPTLLTPENDKLRQAEASPKISNPSSNRLSPPLLPATTNASTGLDGNWIAEMFGGSGISDTASDTANSSLAQAAPLNSRRHGDLGDSDAQDGLKPMELQPLQPGNPGALHSPLLTIAPAPAEGSEHDEWIEDPALGQPGVVLPPFERNPRLNTTRNSREQMTMDDDLPMAMMHQSTAPGQGRLGPADIVNGAPIPNGIPTMPPSRQPVPNRMMPNNMPDMTAQQMPQPPANEAQRPGMQQPQPQPGNPRQTASMQTAPPRLTPQQAQMQRMQQMQEMQRMQMQQRQAAAQQPGRSATSPPPQNRVAQNNPRPPQQQLLVVPPAPTVPNTPMMAPAPMFR